MFPKVPVAELTQLFHDVASQLVGTQSLAEGLFGSPTTVKDLSHTGLAVMPKAGTIVSTKQVANAELTEWTLSNGARVVYKRNRSQPDNFLMKAYSLGGTSVMPDSVASSPGRLVGMLMTASGGLGGVDAETRQAAAQNTGLSEFRVAINTFDEEIAIGGSPRELEYLFQMLYLQFTAPTVDTLALADWRRNGMHKNDMSANDQLAYQVSGNPRLSGPAIVNVPFIDLTQAMRVYRDRFGDASDFTFYLAGPSNPADVLPLVTRYLASLPSTNRTTREVPRDFKIRTMTGKNEDAGRTFYLLPQQSTMSLVFAGKVPTDSSHFLDQMQALNGTSWILGRRLRELLREKMSVTYSASAPVMQYWTPDPRYIVNIQVVVDTLMLDTTVKATLQTVEQLRQNGPTDEELSMATTIRTRQLEVARQQNSWWIEHLQMLDRTGVSYAERPPPLTKARVREAANTFFPMKAYYLSEVKPKIRKEPPKKKEGPDKDGPSDDRTELTR